VRHSVFGKSAETGISFIQGYQIRAEGSFDRKTVEVHFGEFAPGFFAWVIPESGTVARIGLGVRMGENPGERLNQFLQQKSLGVRTLSKTSALIPIGAPSKDLVNGNALLVGDAACQTKATTGGGVIFGMKAAGVCASAVVNELKQQGTLGAYGKNLGEIIKDLQAHWRIYKYIHSLQPKQMDSLFRRAKKAGIERFLQEHGDMDKPTAFMGKMLTSPRMWGLLPTALRLV
jgi:flavin-dependent dehydrogenase